MPSLMDVFTFPVVIFLSPPFLFPSFKNQKSSIHFRSVPHYHNGTRLRLQTPQFRDAHDISTAAHHLFELLRQRFIERPQQRATKTNPNMKSIHVPHFARRSFRCIMPGCSSMPIYGSFFTVTPNSSIRLSIKVQQGSPLWCLLRIPSPASPNSSNTQPWS